MKRLIFVLVILAIIVIIIYVFFEKNYKIEKSGNNKIIIKDLENYITKISSYEAVAEIQVSSNKTTNSYKVRQSEIKGGCFYQEVLEPQAIAGSIFKYNGTNLTIENTKLNIKKIYENYRYISSNQLSLISFLNDYNESNTASYIENETEMVLEVSIQNENRYIAKKLLKVDKITGNPKSLEIHDNTQNLLVYILYNEIKINKRPEEILAFADIDTKREI